MKLLTLCAIVAVNCYKVTARGPGSQYLPPNVSSGGFGGGGPSRVGVGIGIGGGGSGRTIGQSQYQGSSTAHRPISQFNKQQAAGSLIPILRNDYQSDGYGNYNFGFETANGIRREENGIFENVGPEGSLNVQGSYSYTGDDGRIYSINYKADSSGFHAVGDHLPTPPTVISGQQQQQQQHLGSSGYSSFGGGGARGVSGRSFGGGFGGSFGGTGGIGGIGGSTFRRQQQPSTGSFTQPNVNYLPPSVGGLLSSSQSSGYNYARPH